MSTNLTIGDVLPDYLKSNYSQTVLDVPLSEAVQIAVYNEPPTSGLSDADIDSVKAIYQEYQSEGGPNSDPGGSAYWNKSADQNTAYWNKTGTTDSTDTTSLTIGDVLPDYLKSNYSQTVLDVSLTEAVQIAVLNEPPTSDLSEADINSVIAIYQQYQSEGGPDSNPGGSAYWNKSKDDNDAYWNKGA
ncbi:MAG: hypothetical protein ABI921_07440 [Panacibacter sp.]